MREAERRDLQKLCETMLHGDGRMPGLGDLIQNLESRGQVPERITGILIRFGRTREMLTLLTEEGGDARDMRKSQIVVANRLGAIMRREKGEVRLAIETEAVGTSRRLSRLISKEPSRTPVRKTWFPFGGSAELENFLRELDSAEYLRSALLYIDFKARIDPWTNFLREHSSQIKFLVHEAKRRGFQHSGFHPGSFWWRQPTRWEEQKEGPPALIHKTFRGRASGDVLVVIAFVGVLFAIIGFAILRFGLASSASVLAATVILASITSLVLLYFYFKEVIFSSRKLEYWVGKRKRFEAEWKDVESARIWRVVKPPSAYESDNWVFGLDDDFFGFGRGRRRSTLELGLDLIDDMWDLARLYDDEIDDGGVNYEMVIRTSRGELQLKSGWGFSPWTIQSIFEAISRVKWSYPHIKLIDMRRWRRKW